MFKRLMFLILCLAMLVGMGLATTAAIAGDGMYGEMRYRWEGFKNFADWSSDNDDNFGFAHVRSRLGYSTEIGERGLFNMSVQNTRVMGNDGYYDVYDDETGDYQWMSNGNNAVLLNEGYLGISDFLFSGFDIYAGRFAAAYGRERVIGAEEWAVGSEIRFDGFKGHYVFEKGWFDLLCLKLNETFMDKYDDDPGDLDLRGIYAHYDLAEGMYIEPYVLMMSMDNYKDYDDSEELVDVANDNYITFGALFDYMSDSGLHFYAEGLMTSGTEHDSWGTDYEWDTSTLGFYTGLFYEFESTLKPFIGAEFNYASGSSNDDDDNNKDKTFFSPFGSDSSYMGIMDMVDWANTATIRLSGGLTPVEGTDVKLDFYMFKLANDEDSAYGYNFENFGDPGYGSGYWDYYPNSLWGESVDGVYTSKSVGTEIDFFVNHKIEDGVSLEGGAAMFSFGDYFGADNEYDSLLYGWLGAKVEF
jgi:hypothetical protein